MGHSRSFKLTLEASLVFRGLFAGRVETRLFRAYSYGMDVNVWTVDDTEVALQLLELGVDAITTNVPKEISALLR